MVLKVLQVNLQHKKTATAALCQRALAENIDILLIQEPWITKGRIRSGCDANHGSVHGGHDGSQTESRGRWRGTRDDYCVSVPTH
ncbi:hypothetical protein QE152_g19057 [Popillia japonica]|uniref:Endonuclease/exonuclease/phosphatase domain-containing protein n=1 Tax=Popillia japonica TaxID=7064 RepID=A0AAW1L3L9_POPJA